MKIFSLPLNPKLSPNQFNEFINFLSRYKDYIYDIYFTSRIAPFNQDAMGDVFVLQEEGSIDAINAALHIQNTIGIPISATFNNLYVKSDQKNLDLFIKNFKPLYDSGVRSATIPHTSWVLTGKIQAEYPELFIKNTILRDVNRANQVYELAKAGFNYVNLDRDLMRDKDELVKIKKIKEQFPDLKISLLANEGCAGNCSIMPEHYQYNCTRTKEDPQYFNSSIARISCQKWDVEDPAIHLKTANLPPWREDWLEFINDLGIDTIKMHGRESIDRLVESIRIIERFAAGEEILFETFDEYLNDTNLAERPIDAWRKIIKNCKFDCWDCHYCDKIYEKKSGNTSDPKVLEVVDIVAFHDNLELPTVEIPGLTSQRIRKLIYELSTISTGYLEVGCYLGATASAALDADISRAYFVDHWQQEIQTMTRDDIPDNDKQTFIKNIKEHKKSTDIKLFDCNLFDVDLTEISNVDFFFYDGPKDNDNISQAIKYFAPTLADKAVIVVDDANWDGTVDGARQGIIDANLTVLYDKVLLNEVEDATQWWNGVYIIVVQK
jgi:hypothetical protein